MNKLSRRKFQAIHFLTFFLILVSISAPLMEELQQNSASCYKESEAAVLPFYPDGETAFFQSGTVYRGPYGRAQAFRDIIFIVLVLLLIFKVSGASVFTYSRLFLYLIKRFNTSVIAFSLGGRAPPRF
jgi:hypothetical protein